MKKMKGTSCIDDQILCEILSRLPLKSLVRFKCVSKSWKSSIEKDQWLIDLHHRRQLKTNPRLYFLISKAISKSPRLFIVNLMVSFPRNRSVQFESNLRIDTNHEEIITATKAMQTLSDKDLLVCRHIQKPINGMICLIDKIERKDDDPDDEVREDHAACLYNIITKEATPWIRSTYLAQLGQWCDLSEVYVNRTYEFGFDPTTKEYKVICMWSISGWELQKFEGYGEYTLYKEEDGGYCGYYKMCEILTLGNDTAWRRMNKVLPSANYCKDISGSVYAIGSIYWMIYKDLRPILVAFDVKSEEYRVIPDLDLILLDSLDSYYLMELDGRLAIVKNAENHTITLWILDDDCDKNTSTTNTSNIKWIKEIIMLPRWWSYQCVRLHVVEGTNYLILELFNVQSYEACNHDAVFVHSYNRKEKTFSKIEISGDGSPNSSLGANVGHPSYKFTTYVESLLTLQRSYRPATQAPDLNLNGHRQLKCKIPLFVTPCVVFP